MRAPLSRLLLALSVLAAVAPARAQSPDAGVGVLTKPPALLRQVEAAFPPEAADAGVAGTVVMELDLGADGKVTDARVIQSAGHGFDEAALAAVRQFEFSPAEVDGQPAPVRLQYAYEFLFRPEVVSAPVPDGGSVNFAGRLVERGTRKLIHGASVAVIASDGPHETTSDPQGHFELEGVPPGKVTVVVTSPEHARYEVSEEVHEGQRTEVVYYVRRAQYSPYETVVRAQRERKEVAQVSLKQEEIRLIPGTQGDALKVVQNLPGVARAPFGLGLLIVRGGKPWDTRVYVDDAYVPLLFHFGGLNATFNSNLLDEIAFLPGNFSAEYGRNIGGLVKGQTRTPSKEGFHGYADVNLVDTSLLLELPLGEEWSIAVGGRRSYIDVVLPWALKTFAPDVNALSFTVAPRFYDYQLKLEWKPKGKRERFSLTVFGSNDYVSLLLPNPALDPEGRNAFSTLLTYNRLSLHYERQLSERVRSESYLGAGYDQYDFGAGGDLFVYSSIYPVMARQTFRVDVPAANLDVAFGLDFQLIPYHYNVQGPQRLKLNQIPDPFVSRRLEAEETTVYQAEPALFAEAVWRPLPKLKLVPGVRVDYDFTMKDAWVDPRVAAFVELLPSTSLKAAAGLFHQPPDYRQGYLSSKFGNPDLLPEAASHYSLGVEHHFTDAISADVQVYYKSLFHQAQTTLATTDASVDNIDLHYTSTGVGRSYGVELLLRHQLTQNFFGWIAYSFSRSERYYELEGKWGLHPLDQPHNLIAIASYKLPYDFIAGARVRFTSGSLNTPYVGAIYDANGNYYWPIVGELFSRRLPPFFQLDVRIDKRFVFRDWTLSVYADVQNVTNYGNVEGTFNNYDYTQEQFIYGLPILPVLGLRADF